MPRKSYVGTVARVLLCADPGSGPSGGKPRLEQVYEYMAQSQETEEPREGRGTFLEGRLSNFVPLHKNRT